MKYVLLVFFLMSSHNVFAEDGQSLHNSSCIECHSRMTGGDGHVLYTRDDHIAKDIQTLKARVKHCAEGSNIGWNDSKISTITNYLNEQYYHL